jgi:hypothetical protein
MDMLGRVGVGVMCIYEKDTVSYLSGGVSVGKSWFRLHSSQDPS